jgi:hypothetical protein
VLKCGKFFLLFLFSLIISEIRAEDPDTITVTNGTDHYQKTVPTNGVSDSPDCYYFLNMYTLNGTLLYPGPNASLSGNKILVNFGGNDEDHKFQFETDKNFYVFGARGFNDDVAGRSDDGAGGIKGSGNTVTIADSNLFFYNPANYAAVVGCTYTANQADSICIGRNCTMDNNKVFINNSSGNFKVGIAAGVADSTVTNGSAEALGSVNFDGNGVFLKDSTISLFSSDGKSVICGVRFKGCGRSNAVNSTVSVINSEITVKDISAFVGGVYSSSEGSADRRVNNGSVCRGSLLKISDSSLKLEVNNNIFVYGGFMNSESSVDSSEFVCRENRVEIDSSAITSTSESYGFRIAGAGQRSVPVTVTGNKVVADANVVIADNSVRIKGESDIKASEICGGIIDELYGAPGEDGSMKYTVVDLSNNSVVIDGGTVRAEVSGAKIMRQDSETMYSGTGNNEYKKPTAIRGNQVIVNGGTVTGKVAGACSNAVTTASISLTGNRAVVNGGIVNGSVYGGYAEGSGGNPISLSIIGNRVEINGGVVNGGVYGGYIEGSNDAAAVIRDNVVSLGGGTVNGVVCGGFKNNGIEEISGNTLEIRGITGGITAIEHFDNFRFFLSGRDRKSAPLLKVKNSDGGAVVDLTGKNISVDDTGTKLSINDTITLLDASEVANGLIGAEEFEARGTGLVSNKYRFAAADDKLTATVVDFTVSPKLKALAEGHASGSICIARAADLAAEIGGDVGAAAAGAPAGGAASFGTAVSGSQRYKTGSHVSAGGYSAVVGLALRKNFGSGGLASGILAEFGSGGYNSRNDFGSAGAVGGAGETRYIGGGFTERLDFDKTEEGNFYLESSGRMGRTVLSFKSPDLPDASAENGVVSYEAGALYCGLHAGAGRVVNLSAETKLEACCRYLWTRQNGYSVVLLGGRTLDFMKTDAHRIRAGVKLYHRLDSGFSICVGSDFEHGFNCEIKSKIEGRDLPAPNLRGNRGHFEIGLSREIQGLSVSFGLQSYVGTRCGVQMKFNLSYCL